MLASEAIQAVKDYCNNIDQFTGKPIDDATTRDQVLYGNVGQECTGVVTCIWATADVIRQAQELGASLIISHEALFWNHGDHLDTFAGTSTFEAKRALLDEWGGAVWRCHDYIHAGVPLGADGVYEDGIFHGLADTLGWLDYRSDATNMLFEIPPVPAHELASYVVEKVGLSGTRLIGDADATVSKVQVPMHIMGNPMMDNEEIKLLDSDKVDCILAMEFIDFTVSEYIRDAAQLGRGKCAIHGGHFNLEEPGMKYMVRWLPAALGTDDIPVTFLPKGDTYRYIV